MTDAVTNTPPDALSTTKVTYARGTDINIDVEALSIALAKAHGAEERAELQERIVLLTLPLADTIAWRYAGRGMEGDDLLQVARTALVKAIHRYRPGTGSGGFAAFAVPTISGELKRWFRDQGWSVRPPRRVQELRSRLVVEEERMRGRLSRHPRDGELAAELGVSVQDIAEVRLCSDGYRAASLDAVTPSGTCLADHVLVSPCPEEALTLLDALGWAVARLSQEQQLILRLRFAKELTQAEIGDQLGVSQMQVCRLLRGIFDQLRRDINGDGEPPESVVARRPSVHPEVSPSRGPRCRASG